MGKKKPKKTESTGPISGPIREAVLAVGNMYLIAKATEVPYSAVHRFAKGGQVQAAYLDKIAAFLGMTAN